MTDLFEKSIQILELLKHLGQFQNLNGFFKETSYDRFI